MKPSEKIRKNARDKFSAWEQVKDDDIYKKQIWIVMCKLRDEFNKIQKECFKITAHDFNEKIGIFVLRAGLDLMQRNGMLQFDFLEEDEIFEIHLERNEFLPVYLFWKSKMKKKEQDDSESV